MKSTVEEQVNHVTQNINIVIYYAGNRPVKRSLPSCEQKE